MVAGKETSGLKIFGIFLVCVFCTGGFISTGNAMLQFFSDHDKEVFMEHMNSTSISNLLDRVGSVEGRLIALEGQENTTQGFLKGKKWDAYIKGSSLSGTIYLPNSF